MKESCFNSRLNITDKTDVIYNSFTNQFLLIKTGVGLLDLYKGQNNQELVQSGFMVDDNIDEIELVKKISKEVDNSSKIFKLIINPTLLCNFSCWYCYEKKPKKAIMTDEVLKRVFLLIDYLSLKYDRLHISFFGGEPLLFFDKITLPIMTHTQMVCMRNCCKNSISYTTNGYLITEEMITHFTSCNVTGFQITLDGNREKHNSIRFVSKDNGSYDRILDNILQITSNGIHVTIRVNYTDETIDSIPGIMEDLKAKGINSSNKIRVSFHQVWQNSEVDLSNKISTIISDFSANGFKTSIPIFDNVRNPCYGDWKHEALVNYNGDCYKCTAVDFANVPREGYLNAKGQIIWEHDSLNKRMSSKFKNPPCLSCRLLPICNGGCSQKALLYKGVPYCINSFDEKKKDQVVLNKFEYYIRSQHEV